MAQLRIYLKKQMNIALDLLAKKAGFSKNELIRIAVKEFLRKRSTESALKEAFGMWKDYDFDFRELRDEWENRPNLHKTD